MPATGSVATAAPPRSGEDAGLPDYAWDGRRYRNAATGRFVSRAQVLKLLKVGVDEGEDRLRALARAAAKGWLSGAQFETAAQRVLKYMTVANAALAVGGWERLDVGAYDRIGTLLAAQYSYLAGFARGLEDSLGMTPEQAAARASLYAGAAYAAFWHEDIRQAQERGLTLARWQATGDDRTCEDCLALEERGAAPIESFPVPGDGSTACLGNCRCDLIYVE